MESEQSPGFSDYLSALHRRRRLVFGIALPVALAGLVLALALPAVYRSEGMFEIEGAKLQNYLPSIAAGANSVTQLDQYVASLSETVLVGGRLSQLSADLRPYPDAATPAESVKRLRDDISVKMVKRKILDPNTSREREIISGFTVAYDNPDPQMAQRVASWLTDAYAAANREKFRQRASSAAGFLGTEADRFRSRVAGLEEKLALFKAKNAGRLPEQGQVNLDIMDRTDRDLDSTQLQINTLQRERVFLAQQLEQAQANPQADNVRELEAEYARRLTTYDENHPDVVSLRRQIDAARGGGSVDGQSLQAQLDAQRTVLTGARQRYSEDHPDIKRIQRTIDSLESRIAGGESRGGSPVRRTPVIVQLQTQLNAVDTQISGLRTQAILLRSKLNNLEGRVTTSPEVEREYQLLTRDLTTAREKYNDLTNRQMDAELSESAIAGGRGDEFRIVQAPSAPTSPAKPPRLAISLLALVAALLAGLTAAVIAESTDSMVRGTHDLRRTFDMTPLAVVPEIETPNSIAALRHQVMTFSGALAAGAVVLFVAVRLLA